MLILTRKYGESIIIGEDIKITILDCKGKNVRIGVEAPRNVAVHRQDGGQVVQEKSLKPEDGSQKTEE